jgi:hypothetical protein
MNKFIRTILSAIALPIIFIGWVLPIVLIPFVYMLPYLHTLSTDERRLWSMAVSLIVICCVLGLFILKGSIPKVAWKESWLILGAIGLITIEAADLSANTFGTLVKLFPTTVYIEQVEVVSVKRTKHKAAELELRDPINKNNYFLTLSKKLFDDSIFSIGDKLLLRGERNDFGVYVKNLEVVKNQ